ncbi:MAG TPA: HAD hydrolase family protein [Gemmatimonadales bacterium]|nr:HAD hydrolase family protein [Gemmatimonadales bacterium]
MPVEHQALQPAPPPPRVARAEADFYAAYAWCLNPLLPLRDLLVRLREELDRFPTREASWQRDEARLNLFLFVCGVASILDEHLARRPFDLSDIGPRFPRLQPVVTAVQRVLDAISAGYAALADQSISRWRIQWSASVDQVSRLLGTGAEPSDAGWDLVRSTLEALAAAALPERLLQRRLSVPPVLRGHHVTYHDVLSLTERFAASYPDPGRGAVVIAPRSVGSYFAPLVAARLTALGWRHVSWLTIRPEHGLSRWEERSLRALASSDVRVVVVDDPPTVATANRGVFGLLTRLGVARQRMAFIALLGSAQDSPPDVAAISLAAADCYKVRLLAPDPFRELLEEYREERGARVVGDAAVDEFNAGARAGLERAFALRRPSAWPEPSVERVLATSVGWGWLGYHAYVAATRLAGFVPGVIGLRHGLLVTEWVGGARRQPGDRGLPSPRAVATYVARRTASLRLEEDPVLAGAEYRGSGWQTIVDLLRRAHGLYVGRLKIPVLRRKIRDYRCPVPIAVDGRMQPEAWVVTERGVVKTNFAQPGLGEGELNVVDPAHDLAAAIFEFAWSPHSEAELLETYAEESGDRTVSGRLLLYKLLVGVRAMQQAARGVVDAPSRGEQERWNVRYHAARNFLVDHMARHCGGLTPRPERATWSTRLFFLDLDGVFDCDRFGFPHASASGLAAIALLRTQGFSVVLNTGRSIGDIRRYCDHYALPGGVAELGTVFFDAVAQREVPLIDETDAAQLARCAQAITQLPGVLVDPAYRYTIRAYRMRALGPVALEPPEVRALLTRCALDRLSFDTSAGDTFILPRGRDKGHAVAAVKQYVGCATEPVAAMGDSLRDVPMLAAAEFAFAPANCSPCIEQLAREGKCRVVRQPVQRGLLSAARQLTRRSPRVGAPPPNPAPRTAREDLVTALLRVAERSWPRQVLAALDLRSL